MGAARSVVGEAVDHGGCDDIAGATRTSNLPTAAETTGQVDDVARLVAVNTAACDYYRSQYPGSWAPAYLESRVGDCLVDDPTWQPGYAPAGWTHLVDHLHATGHTDTDILDAGLGTRARTGHLIDRFRDRLVFPIHNDTGDTIAFIGRRNPTATDTDGPKYLNTADTALYRKGHQLFGATEQADTIRAGATTVIVEGPLDAIAITRADGAAVGVAPLGTALTHQQVECSRFCLHSLSGTILLFSVSAFVLGPREIPEC